MCRDNRVLTCMLLLTCAAAALPDFPAHWAVHEEQHAKVSGSILNGTDSL